MTATLGDESDDGNCSHEDYETRGDYCPEIWTDSVEIGIVCTACGAIGTAHVTYTESDVDTEWED